MSRVLKKAGFEIGEENISETRVKTSSTSTTTTTTTTTTSTSTSTEASGPCKEGWRHIGEGCYLISDE